MPASPAPSPEERKRLISLQEKMASEIVLEDQFSEGLVAGVDQAFISRKDDSEMVISGAVTLDTSLRPLSKSWAILDATFPYVPGLLSFREGPSAIEAVRRLETRPTLLFVDGCGINHPRRAGLASIIGVTLDVPTIGVSKNVLCGSFNPPGQVGDASPLVYEGERVGYVLFSKKRCRPIVVAPGHRVSLDGALDLARRYLRDHKLPEPCFMAHQHANQVKRRILSDDTALSSS